MRKLVVFNQVTLESLGYPYRREAENEAYRRFLWRPGRVRGTLFRAALIEALRLQK